MDKVIRTFAAPIRIKVGQIVDASGWRNAGFLRRRGYLQPVEGEAHADPIEEVAEHVVPELPSTEAEPEVVVNEVTEVNDLTDPLEAVAAMPVEGAIEADPVEETVPVEPDVIPTPPKPLSKMTKAELVHYAGQIGVKVSPDSMTNKQIIALIEEKL